jgi:hypothetical protein
MDRRRDKNQQRQREREKVGREIERRDERAHN